MQKIKTLLENTVLKYIEETDDNFIINETQRFDRMERVFYIHSTCLNEVCNQLTLNNLKDLSSVIFSIFKGYKYIYEGLLTTILSQHEELAEIKNKKTDVVYMVKEVGRKLAEQPSVLFLDSFKDEKQIEQEKKIQQTVRLMNFQDEEQEREIIEKRKKVVMKKVDILLGELERGNKSFIKYEEEADVLFAFCKAIFDKMREEKDILDKMAKDAVANADQVLSIKAEAPLKMEKIVNHILDSVRKIDIDKIMITEFESEKEEKEMTEIEKLILDSVDDKQRYLVMKVLRILGQVMKPKMKTKETMTTLTHKQLESQKAASTVPATAVSSAKVKVMQDECVELRRITAGQSQKISDLEDVVGELMNTINDKEAEVIHLLRKYETSKATEAALERRKDKLNEYGSKVTQVLAKAAEPVKPILASTREKFRNFIKEITKAVLKMRGDHAVQETMPIESMTMLKDQLAAAFKDIIAQEAETDQSFMKNLKIESIIEDQIRILYSEDTFSSPIKSEKGSQQGKRESVNQEFPNSNPQNPDKVPDPTRKSNESQPLVRKGSTDTNSIRNKLSTVPEKADSPETGKNSRTNIKNKEIPNSTNTSKDRNKPVNPAPISKFADPKSKPKNAGKDGNKVDNMKPKTSKENQQKENLNTSSRNDKETDDYLSQLSEKLEEIKNHHFKSDLIELIDMVIRLGNITSNLSFDVGNGRFIVKYKDHPHPLNIDLGSNQRISREGGKEYNENRGYAGHPHEKSTHLDQVRTNGTADVQNTRISVDKPEKNRQQVSREVRKNISISTQTDHHITKPQPTETDKRSDPLNYLATDERIEASKQNRKQLVRVHSIEKDASAKDVIFDIKMNTFIENLKANKIFDKLYEMTFYGTSLPQLLGSSREEDHQINPKDTSSTAFFHNNLSKYSKNYIKGNQGDENQTMDHTRKTSMQDDGTIEDQETIERWRSTNRDKSGSRNKLSHSQTQLANFFRPKDFIGRKSIGGKVKDLKNLKGNLSLRNQSQDGTIIKEIKVNL